MKSERRSSAKGKLKLVKITFINRHFLVKEKVVAGGKMLFLFDARKTGFITTLILSLTTCLDTRQPGTVFKKLGTRQSEILTNFLEIARLIPLRT